MDLQPKHLRIANYNKLVDKFITVQVKKSSNPKTHGTIYAIIEILCPWNQNSQIGQSIINTLSREFYKQTNKNELINFENSLKKVNERLVQITQNGETDWIGKINAALILVKKDNIHIAYTGKIRGYLQRKNNILPIINHKENYTYHHPLKTFSNVISGQLKSDDKIFFSTNQIFDYINSKKLQKILSEEDIEQNSIQIASILKSRNLNSSNAILIQMFPEDKPIDNYNDVIYLDEQRFAYFIQSTKNIFKKTGEYFSTVFNSASKQFSKSKKYYNDKIAPNTKKAWDKTKNFTKNNKQLKNISKKAKDISSNISKKTSSKKSQSSAFSVNHYSGSTQKVTLFLKKLSDKTKAFFRKAIVFLKNAFTSKNRSRTYIVIALILFVIFITNIGYLQKINNDKEYNSQIEQQVKDLEIKKDDANLAILTDDKERASTLLNEILEQIKEYENNPNFTQRIEALKNEVNELLDKISNIERLSASAEIINFENCTHFYLIDKQIYCVNPQTNQILNTTENSENPASEVGIIPDSNGNFSHASILDSQLILATNENNLFKLTDNNLNQISNSSGSWPASIAIASFYENLYLLESSVGQIYKFTPSGENYSSAEEYLVSDVDITNSIDLTIDGSIYVLKNDGSIIKLSLGSQENFEIRGIPEPNSSVSNPKKIYTNEEIDSIFILDENRVLELSKDGDYKNQYNFEKDKENISDFYINTKAREIYILNNSILYKYNY